jgi:hypothetical protein
MKIKTILPNEEFIMHNKVFTYTVEDGKLKITPLRSVDVKKKGFVPPTLDEVKKFFKEKGYSEAGAIKAWEHYEYGEPKWTDTHGTPVRAWKQKMNTNWLKPEYLIHKQNSTPFFQE